MGSPFPIAFLMGPPIIFQGHTASLIGHFSSFALMAVLRVTDIVLLSVYFNSQATMDIMLTSPRLEETSSEQFHTLLNKLIN